MAKAKTTHKREMVNYMNDKHISFEETPVGPGESQQKAKSIQYLEPKVEAMEVGKYYRLRITDETLTPQMNGRILTSLRLAATQLAPTLKEHKLFIKQYQGDLYFRKEKREIKTGGVPPPIAKHEEKRLLSPEYVSRKAREQLQKEQKQQEEQGRREAYIPPPPPPPPRDILKEQFGDRPFNMEDFE